MIFSHPFHLKLCKYVCRTCKWHRIYIFVCKLCVAWSTRIFQSLSFLQNTSVDSICLQLSNKFVNPPCAVISIIIVTNKIWTMFAFGVPIYKTQSVTNWSINSWKTVLSTSNSPCNDSSQNIPKLNRKISLVHIQYYQCSCKMKSCG